MVAFAISKSLLDTACVEIALGILSSFDFYLRISDVYHLTESNFVFHEKPSNTSKGIIYLEEAKSNSLNQTVHMREQFIVTMLQTMIDIRKNKGLTRLMGVSIKLYREAIKRA